MRTRGNENERVPGGRENGGTTSAEGEDSALFTGESVDPRKERARLGSREPIAPRKATGANETSSMPIDSIAAPRLRVASFISPRDFFCFSERTLFQCTS